MKRWLIVGIIVLYVCAIGAMVWMRPPMPAKVVENKDFALTKGRTINGDVVVAHGNAKISGRVNGSVIVRDGKLSVEKDAVITKDAVSLGGTMLVAKGATIQGKRIDEKKPPLGRRPFTAKIGGPMGAPGNHGEPRFPGIFRAPTEGPRPGGPGPPNSHDRFGPRFLFTFLRISILIGVAILIAKTRPIFLKRTTHALMDHPISSIIVGAALLAGIFMGAGMIRHLPGRPIFMPLGLVIDIVTLLFAVVTARVIGLIIEGLLKEELGIMQQTVFGVLVLGGLILLPFIGPTITVASVILGIGSIIMLVFDTIRAHRTEAVAEV